MNVSSPRLRLPPVCSRRSTPTPGLDDPALAALLARRAEALLGRLDELRALRAQVDEEHALAIFDYEILRQEADLAWTRSLLKESRH